LIKIVATRCRILNLKCTNFDFGWGSAPDSVGGAHDAPPDLLAGFKRSYFHGFYGQGRGSQGKSKYQGAKVNKDAEKC